MVVSDASLSLGSSQGTHLDSLLSASVWQRPFPPSAWEGLAALDSTVAETSFRKRERRLCRWRILPAPLQGCAPDPQKSWSLAKEWQFDFMCWLFCFDRQFLPSCLHIHDSCLLNHVGSHSPLLNNINHIFYSSQLSREVFQTSPSPLMQISNRGS